MLDPTTKKIVKDLEKTFNEMLDSFSLEELIAHFKAYLKVHKQAYNYDPSKALSAEKIAILENAIKQFEEIYRAEKVEAEKMPLSWHEADHVRKLFDEIYDDFNPIPESRVEH
ncbi:MAG: hypothetical protein K1X72_17485 [Pyrinomonadaceae bacterium]|nr:hypothetical protein [Pyrinomonadaceae bacterium]